MNLFKYSLLLLVIVSLKSLSVYAGNYDKKLPPLPRTEESKGFVEALASAYATNPTLQAKVAEQKATAESVPKAKAGWLPTVNAETSITRSRTDSESPSPQGTVLRNTTSGGVTASQNVFSGGGTTASISAAENQVRAGWADFTNTEQDTLLAACTAYLELFAAYEVYKLNLKNEAVFKELLKSTQTRAELGELTRTDVASAQSELADAITKRITADADLETKKGTYLKVIGLEAPQTQDLPALPVDLLPKDLSELTEQALAHNPRIVNADYSSRANYDSIGVAQAALLPSVKVNGSATRTVSSGSTLTSSTSNSRQNSYQAGATLSIPIFQGGAEWSDLRKARQTSTQSKISLVATRQAVQEACQTAWERWVSVRLRIEQIKTQIRSAEINLNGVRSEFKEGERIFIEVLDAENKLFNAKVSLETAKKDLYVAAYTLLSLTGELTAESLKLPVEKYDVEGHYNLVKNKWFGTTNG